MVEEKIEAVKKISKAMRKDPVVEHELALERVAPNKEQFDTLMHSRQAQDTIKTNKIESITAPELSQAPSLMDHVKNLNSKVNRISELTPEALKNQTKDAIAQIDEAKTKLEEVKLQLDNTQSGLKPSYQALIKNRLTHIDDNIRIALSKAGTEYPVMTPPQQKGLVNPIERFLGFVTHGQYQLEHLSQTVDQLNLTGAQLTPAHMLALQIKIGQVQQEIELFTNLLNKMLESTKTIMNVQV
jgi:hypothetical protein